MIESHLKVIATKNDSHAEVKQKRFGDGRVGFDGGEVANMAAIGAGIDGSSGSPHHTTRN